MSRVPAPPDGFTVDETPSRIPSPPAGFTVDTSPETALRLSAKRAAPINPDRQAQVLTLSSRTGLPTSVIQRNFEDIQKRAEITDADFSKMLRETPKTAQFLTNPDNAAVAKDDHQSLTLMESLYRMAGQNIAIAAARRLASGIYQTIPSTLGFLETLEKAPGTMDPSKMRDARFREYLKQPVITRPTALAAELESARKLTAAAGERIRGARAPNAYVEAALSGVESIGQMVPTVALGLAGGPAAAFAGMFATTAGQAMPQALDKGVDPATAFLFGGAQGTIEVATEMLPIHVVLDQLKVGGKLSSFLLKELATEIPGEQFATLFQDLNEWAVDPENKNKSLADYKREHDFGGAAVDTLIATVVGTLGFGGITAAASHYIHGKAPQQVFLEQVGETVKESALAQRSPETAAQFVDHVAEGTGAEKVYISADAIRERAQAVKMDPGALADSMTVGGREKLEEATKTGQDVEISASDYALKVEQSEHAAFFKRVTRVGDPMTATAEEAEAVREQALADLTPEEIAQEEEIQTNLATLNSPEVNAAIQAAVEAPPTPQEDMVTLYRGETTPGTGPGAPSWISAAENEGVQAGRRWFTSSLENAKYYQTEAGETGRIVQVEVPRSVWEAAQQNEITQRFSRRPEEEGFIPAEYAAKAGTEPAAPESFIDRIEREARERIQKRGVRLGAGIDPFTGADYVLISAAQIARGVRTFGQWSAWAISEYGERARPYLRALYARSVAKAVEIFSMDPQAFKEAAASAVIDDAVTEAEAEAADIPLFTTAADAGMTEEDFAKYQTRVEAASAKKREALQAEWRKSLAREQTDWYQARRAEEEAIVAAELNRNREQQAVAYLQHGTLPNGDPLLDYMRQEKIDQRALEKRYGKHADSLEMQALRKIDAYRTNTGIHPDVMAEWLGYKSADEMVQAVIQTPKYEEALAAETDLRMQEKYGNLLTDGTLDQKARDAVMIIDRAEIVVAEMKALQQAVKESGRQGLRDLKAVRVADARRAAKEQTARTLSKDLNPSLHYAAARRESLGAVEAFQKGDMEGAFAAKNRELLNLELYRAHRAAQDNIADSRREFQKFFRPDTKLAPTHTMDFVEAARAIAANLFFAGRAETIDQALGRIATYDPQAHEMIQTLIPPIRFVTYEQAPYGDVSDLIDIANELWIISSRDSSARIEGQLIQRDQITGELKTRLADLSTRYAGAGVKGQLTRFEKAERWFLGLKAWGRRMESWVTAMDGGPQGPFRTYLWNPIKEATDRYRVRKVEYLTQYKALLEPIQATLTMAKIAAPELGYTFGDDGSGGRAELLGALLHAGNRVDAKSNLAKLLIGRGWGRWLADGTLDTTRWDAFIARLQREGVLTKADYDFIQGVWDLFESLKPDLQKAHREVYGFYFEEVPADRLITPWGVYRGGYVPALADPLMTEAAAIRNEKQMTFETGTSWALPSAGRKSTIARVVTAEPLSMNLTFIPQHIDWALRFAEIQTAAKDATRIMTDKSFRAALGTHDPEAAQTMIMPWLMRAATQRVSESGKWKGLDRFMTAVRARTALQILTFNVGNAMQQTTGLIVASVKINKKRYLANGAYRYFRAPKETGQFIRERSPFMQTFLTSQAFEIQKEIDHILLNPSVYARSAEFLRRNSSVLAAGTQNIVNHIAWIAAHEEATAAGVSAEDAVRRADSVVRETQGSFFAEDISRFEANSPFVRAISMFASYFNMDANLLFTETGNALRSDRGAFGKAGRVMSVYALGFMLPAVISRVILNALSGDWDDDDDDTRIDELLNLFVSAQAQTAFAMIPVVGQFANATYGALATSQTYDDEIRSSPTAGMIGSGIKDLAGHSTTKQEVKDFLSIVGLISNLPLGALGKPLGYLIDVGEGKAEPENAIDVARGLVSGRTPKR